MLLFKRRNNIDVQASKSGAAEPPDQKHNRVAWVGLAWPLPLEYTRHAVLFNPRDEIDRLQAIRALLDNNLQSCIFGCSAPGSQHGSLSRRVWHKLATSPPKPDAQNECETEPTHKDASDFIGMNSFPHCCAPPQAKEATAKEYITCRACALRPPNSFWPWGVFSESGGMPDYDDLGSRGKNLGHVPVMLSRGDGARGELELLACVCQRSLGFLASGECHV